MNNEMNETAIDTSSNVAIDTPTDNRMDTPTDTPMTSEGFGMTSGQTPALNSNVISDVAPAAGFNFDGLRERGLELATSLNQQTRANPWLTVGLVGVGALALGYIFGRRSPSYAVAPEVRGIARENDRYEKFAGYAD